VRCFIRRHHNDLWFGMNLSFIWQLPLAFPITLKVHALLAVELLLVVDVLMVPLTCEHEIVGYLVLCASRTRIKPRSRPPGDRLQKRVVEMPTRLERIRSPNQGHKMNEEKSLDEISMKRDWSYSILTYCQVLILSRRSLLEPFTAGP
jgi:hypothetical protein